MEFHSKGITADLAATSVVARSLAAFTLLDGDDVGRALACSLGGVALVVDNGTIDDDLVASINLVAVGELLAANTCNLIGLECFCAILAVAHVEGDVTIAAGGCTACDNDALNVILFSRRGFAEFFTLGNGCCYVERVGLGAITFSLAAGLGLLTTTLGFAVE